MKSKQALPPFYFFWISIVVLIAGCQAIPRTISQQELLENRPDFISDYQSDIDKSQELSTERIASEYSQALLTNQKEPQSYDVLILSGGGAFGAFGAGFLDGWGQVSVEGFERPTFDSVSGISTGSLIAPFAFIGTSEAYEKIIQLYENPGEDWVKKVGFIPFLPSNSSLFDVSKFHETVESVISPTMISEMAKGAADGR